MIYVFSGDDREKIATEVRRVLGSEYEVFEGEGLSVQDLMNIFQGTSLFAAERKILIKDLTPEKSAEGEVDFYAELLGYVDTPHTVVIWETRTSRKKSYKEFLRAKNVVSRSFAAARPVEVGKVFEIFDTAYRDGARAVKMVEEVRGNNDPYMFFGLLVTQALKKCQRRFTTREKRVLRELSKLDMQMKSTTIEPWALISSFLLRVSSM